MEDAPITDRAAIEAFVEKLNAALKAGTAVMVDGPPGDYGTMTYRIREKVAVITIEEPEA
jgi:hypothetical protein